MRSEPRKLEIVIISSTMIHIRKLQLCILPAILWHHKATHNIVIEIIEASPTLVYDGNTQRIFLKNIINWVNSVEVTYVGITLLYQRAFTMRTWMDSR